MRVVMLGCLLACGCDSVFRVDHVATSELGDGGLDGAGDRSIAYVQSAGAATSKVSELDVRFEAPVTAGNLVVVAVATFHGGLLMLTDSAGNTYLQPLPPVESNSGAFFHVYYAPNVMTTEPFTVKATVLASADNEVTMAVHDYTGASADPLGKYVMVAGGSSTKVSSGPVRTTLEGELYFGAMTHDHTTVTHPGTGYTVRERPAESNVATVPMVTEDKVGPPGDATAAEFTLEDAGAWVCALLTFK